MRTWRALCLPPSLAVACYDPLFSRAGASLEHVQKSEVPRTIRTSCRFSSYVVKTTLSLRSSFYGVKTSCLFGIQRCHICHSLSARAVASEALTASHQILKEVSFALRCGNGAKQHEGIVTSQQTHPSLVLRIALLFLLVCAVTILGDSQALGTGSFQTCLRSAME